ncbi:hypothetical protein FOFC_10798 [Fusarium oxysporum]|nr:hypothetical protein FocnCong_v010151 [Fusarium oxysporum f. sp. conglutinans]KAI8395740.1 hypothetical protein FOFC_21270 [Fusarium oxysporum]KAG6998611.1 hypothetical protein FocnCong_v013655 [Fusarium oxysporum f. sp. conglutinans]KAG7003036.1 hypothetical protein FocnCong_v000492 [Fusarium oxysporum f. sp. conglutinans]KAG7003762.1 hypothetical protein FocnCong_v000916 [Fusarium oxysporum f. sp. conglutinans]
MRKQLQGRCPEDLCEAVCGQTEHGSLMVRPTVEVPCTISHRASFKGPCWPENVVRRMKLVNGASYTAVEVIVDKAYPGHRISADVTIHFGPPAGILLESETTKDLHFVGMPPGTILLTPMSVRIHCQRKRPWQKNDVSRKGLPCAAAFACTDYKVQSRTLERVALELRGTRTTNVDGRVVPSQCDPHSLYVQLSRCRTLDGIMLVSKVRERDLVGNRVPEEMTAAQARLEKLSDRTVQEALRWFDDESE